MLLVGNLTNEAMLPGQGPQMIWAGRKQHLLPTVCTGKVLIAVSR